MATVVYLLNDSGTTILGPIGSTGNTVGGITWKLKNIEGWYDMPITVPQHHNPMSQQASRPLGSHRGGRAYTVIGFVYGGTAEQAIEDAWMKLSALDWDGTGMSMHVYDESSVTPKQVSVWLADTIQVRPFKSNGAMFMIPLWAPDPRKWPVDTAHRQTLTLPAGDNSVSGVFNNIGSAPAQFVFLINPIILASRFPISITGFSGSTSLLFSASAEGDFSSGGAITLSPDWGGVITQNNVVISSRQMDLAANGTWPFIAPFTTRTITITTATGTLGTGGFVTAEMYSVWY